MTFADLPQNWSQRPITDPDIFADVLDLVCDDTSRRSGALYLILCEPDGRLISPIAIDKVPQTRPPQEIADSVKRLFAQLVTDPELPSTLVVAVTRPGSPTLTTRDRMLREALNAAALECGVTLLGFGIATPHAIHTFPGATPNAPSASRRIA